jgi:cellobiose-specific phosphotransferase system component IIB
MRRLVVFGDSFVEGYRRVPAPNVTEFNMCHYLSEELGVDVLNLGFRGNSNLAIANSVLRFIVNELDDSSEVAFLVVFSGWERVTLRTKQRSHERVGALVGVSVKPHNIGKVVIDGQGVSSDMAILRCQTELAYLGVKQACQEHNIPVRFINSIDHQIFIDKLESSKIYEDGSIEIMGSFSLKSIKPNDETWIEPNSLYNTLLDIITDRWLHEGEKGSPEENHRMLRGSSKKFPGCTSCFHPTISGNKKIAKILSPYLKQIL